MPPEAIIRKERFKITPAVYIIFMNDEAEILLMRRRNTGYEDGNYDLPSGHKEVNEYPTETAQRESAEETGLTVEELELKHVMMRIRQVNSERVDLFFLAKKWLGIPQILEPEKCDDLVWANINNLPENTIPCVRYALEQFSLNPDQITYSEYGK